jgi:hypothetical protein
MLEDRFHEGLIIYILKQGRKGYVVVIAEAIAHEQ